MRYFGEKAPDRCDMCLNCENSVSRVDVTPIALNILSCVKESRQRFGAAMIVNLLRGSKDAKIRQYGLTALQTYGALSQFDVGAISEILDGMVDKGFLLRTEGKYPMIRLGENAGKLLSGEMTMTARNMPVTKEEKIRARIKPVKTPDLIECTNSSLLEALRKLRAEIAYEKNVMPSMVLTEASLVDLSAKRPHTLDELLEVNGIGEAKKQRYGNQILKAIYEWEAENE